MTRLRLSLIALVLGFVGLIGLFSYTLTRGPSLETMPSVLIGKPAPAFALAALPGVPPEAPLSDGDLAGHVTLVNFWASWCLPCEAEAPELAKLAARPGLQLVGIDWKDKPDAAKALLKKLGSPYARIGQDPTGRTGIDWGISGVPETFVVGPDQRIIVRFAGPLTPQDVRRVIDPALAKAAAVR